MRKLAIFSAAFTLAAAVFVYLFRDVRALWLAGACLALSFAARLFGLRRVFVAALGAVVGLLWCFGYLNIWLAPVNAASGTQQVITLCLQDNPVETQYGVSFMGKVKLSGRSYEAVLYADEQTSSCSAGAGDFVTCMANIQVSGLEIEKGESIHLRAGGVQLSMQAVSALQVEQGTPTLPQRLRQWLRERIGVLYEDRAEGLLLALLTGDQSGLTDQVLNELSVAGLRHAVAVSGMHISILIAVAAYLSLGNPRLLAALGIPLVIVFALMTGASASVCRAAVMQILMLSAPLARRPHDGPTTLGAAALVLLLQNPWAVASISFQLSFAAVAGLFLFSGPIQKKILSVRKKPGRLLRFVASGVSATLSATVTTLPLTVFYFGLVSIAAPLTNLLALWAVTLVFVLGLLSCCLGPLGFLPAWLVRLLSAYILDLCGWIAVFPYAAAYAYNLPLMIWAICAFVGTVVLLRIKRKLPVLLPLCVLTAGFLGCILWGRWSYTGHDWRFTALDVGSGQCLVCQVGDYTAVIDCGGSGNAGEEAVRFFHSAGITRIDALILTHYDLDHCSGALQLQNRIKINGIFLPAVEDDTGIAAQLHLSDSPVYTVETPTKITVPGGEICLYPSLSEENEKNAGVSVLATAAEYDILITGDLDHMAEMRLLSAFDIPDVDLLVSGHHGAATSTSSVLLDAVKPETVVISVGTPNRYGHPAEETLRRIQQTGAEILRTDQLGTITVTP